MNELITNSYSTDSPEYSTSAMQEFDQRKNLVANAAWQAAHVERMRRGSSVVTDDDIKNGFEAILKPADIPIFRKVVGQVVMLVGTAGISLWPVHPGLPVFGGLFCVVGILIREYTGK